MRLGFDNGYFTDCCLGCDAV